MDRGAWRSTVHGVTKLTEGLPGASSPCPSCSAEGGVPGGQAESQSGLSHAGVPQQVARSWGLYPRCLQL